MIRMIEEKDIQACLDLYNWYIENTTITFETNRLTLQEYTTRVETVRKKYPWIVLVEENQVVGFAYLAPFNEREAYDWTADVSIYLSATERGKGYGKKLMKELIYLAQVNGYRKLVSLITMGNEASEHIHTSFGFEKNAELKDVGYKFGDWLGVCIYTKEIQNLTNDMQKPKNNNPYEGA